MTESGGGRGAGAVAAGILASRVLGLVRQKAFAYFLGDGAAADAFNVALRIPNVLQNLFGEGVLSASFIPVYVRARRDGGDERRRAVAGAVFGTLALGVAILTLAGVLLAPLIVRALAPGFDGAQQALTVQLVRIFFPGAGVLVLSAWCLGILNAHGRFLLSYASPVAWNLAILAALLGWGGRSSDETVVIVAAWGSVIGSALQLLVQWPAVQGALGTWRPRLGARDDETRTVFRNFWPAFVGRGVTQLSAFIDVGIASILVQGSATMLANAQAVYMLPVSLFGMSVAAAALPGLSAVDGDDARRQLRAMLDARLRQVAFFVIPSAVAFLVLGDSIVHLLFVGGAFAAPEAEWQRLTLAAAGVGLVGATLGRLYSTTLYALQDTRTPQRTAITRVAFAAVVGITGAVVAAPRLGWDPRYGIVWLLLASSLAAWVEWTLLRRHVVRRIGAGTSAVGRVLRVWGAAALAAAVALAVASFLGSAPLPEWFRHGLVLGVYGTAYIGLAHLLGVFDGRAMLRRLLRR